MSTLTLYSLSAVASILSGIFIILGSVLNDLLKRSKGAFYNFLGALIGLFGITGIYLYQREEAGIFGFIAYVFIFIGLALIACIDYSGSFVTPNLSDDQKARLGKSSAMQATYFSFLIFLIGDILFGIMALSAGVFPKIATVFFMIGFLATMVRPVYQIITFIGLSLSGIGLIWWGVSMWMMVGTG